MTDNTNQDQVREQLKSLAENSYRQGFKDAQVAIAEVFNKLDAGNEEANNLYREIAKVINQLQILDENASE